MALIIIHKSILLFQRIIYKCGEVYYMDMQDEWTPSPIFEHKDICAKVLMPETGLCPFHPSTKLKISQLYSHFFSRCKQAKKHLTDNKYYAVCNCARIFIDEKVFSEHKKGCILAKQSEQILPQLGTSCDWHTTVSKVNMSSIPQILNATNHFSSNSGDFLDGFHVV